MALLWHWCRYSHGDAGNHSETGKKTTIKQKIIIFSANTVRAELQIALLYLKLIISIAMKKSVLKTGCYEAKTMQKAPNRKGHGDGDATKKNIMNKRVVADAHTGSIDIFI